MSVPEITPKVKRAAAKCGRTFYRREEHEAARGKLRALLEKEDVPSLRWYAKVVMIDDRWNGATGEGGYWAVASRCLNEDALAELRRRRDAWRAAGLGPIATIEAVREAGL